MKRLRVVVCGTTFGQFYLAALAGAPLEFEIAGVLATGSERSVACARRFGVPLLTDPEQVPADVDLACVVVRSGVLGGSGTELALRLLRRGIHVLQEPPVHHDDLVACLREARRQGVQYRLGDLYVRLPAVRRFVAAARALLDRRTAVHLDAACSHQVTFPLLHILGDALGTLRPWRISGPEGGAEAPFPVLTGEIGGVALTLRVHNQVDPADPDNHLPLLHRVAVATGAGTLTLADTHGPVLWSPRLHVPAAVKERFDFAADGPGYLDEPSTSVLGPVEPPSYSHVLSELWPAAVRGDLLALRAAVLGDDPGAKRPDQYHLTLSRMWQDVTSRLGYPALRPGQDHQPLPVAQLAAAAAVVEDETLPGRVPGSFEEIVRTATDAAQRQVRHLTAAQVDGFVARLDEAVLHSMLLALQGHGVLHGGGPAHTGAEILAAARVAAAHHGLVERWLAVLCARGLVRRDGDRFHGTRTVEAAEAARAWDAAAEAWSGGLGSAEFVDYLRRNAERLPELMTGEQQAALLLFPEGRTETARAVYRDTVTARYLNTAVASVLRSLAASRPAERPLRVLEIGAGTGATTEASIHALGPSPHVDYLFTDVSRFFLGPAQERFAHHPWLRFGLFDIDRAPREQGYEAGCAEVIIAAGVLNNARDTDASVRALVSLLAPGGWLLITEPTREHLELLASQAFMMTAAEDARLRSGTTCLTEGQWLDVLDAAGLTEIAGAPAAAHPLAPLGQRLFAARLGPTTTKDHKPCTS